MMNYNRAIEILSEFHNSQLVCVVRHELTGRINAQLSTGIPELPFIAVNDNQVNSQDVETVIELYASQNVYI